MKKIDLPKNISVFPLSNFIIFPNTTVPLNIFEPRYIDMINDSMKSNKMIGMIQPKNSDQNKIKKITNNLMIIMIFKRIIINSMIIIFVFDKIFSKLSLSKIVFP